MADEYDRIPEEVFDKLTPEDKAKLFKAMIKPDYNSEKALDIAGITPFMKELKVSYLTPKQIRDNTDIFDIASLWAKLGANDFAQQLLGTTGIGLSMSASKNGMLIKLMNSQFNFQKLETVSGKKKARSFFRKKQNREDIDDIYS